MCLCQIWLSMKSQYKCGPPQSLYTESLSVNYSSPVSCAKNTKSIVVGTMQTEYKLNFNGKKNSKYYILFHPPNLTHRHTHTHTQRRGGRGKTTVWFCLDLLSLCECFQKEVKSTDKKGETLGRRVWESTSKAMCTSLSFLPPTCGNTYFRLWLTSNLHCRRI